MSMIPYILTIIVLTGVNFLALAPRQTANRMKRGRRSITCKRSATVSTTTTANRMKRGRRSISDPVDVSSG